jgi:threonine/homoserine/homoserine lactone efflux protein
LGDFSPNGRLLASSKFLITEVALIFCATFSFVKFCINFQKMVRAELWATFSQTHPVTLSVIDRLFGQRVHSK